MLDCIGVMSNRTLAGIVEGGDRKRIDRIPQTMAGLYVIPETHSNSCKEKDYDFAVL